MSEDVGLNKIEIGSTASQTRTLDAETVRKYAALIGDANPIHTDEEFAAKTSFGRPIAHGLLAGGLISGILGSEMPGPGSIYMSQTFSFLKPVFVGDTVVATCTVVEVQQNRRCVVETIVTDSVGDVVIRGEALVRLPRRAIDD